MFEVEINGKKCKAEVTFYTAQLYEEEFQSDMLKDFLGVQVFDEPLEMSSDSVLKIDFTKTNWLASAKVLWAAIKTVDKHAPSYVQWMKNTSGVNMWLVQDILGAEVADCFFRADVAREETEEQDEQ